MSLYPRKFLIDTNIPKTANLATNPDTIPQELTCCVNACIEAVQHVIKNGGLVMDAGDEIFDEYRHNLSLRGQPGVGDGFLKWVHDHRWSFPEEDRVVITKEGESYVEFPQHDGLALFDNSDRKFIAVSFAHPSKPHILQATDSKWWGWNSALNEVGINVKFLCPDYIQTKYLEKIGE